MEDLLRQQREEIEQDAGSAASTAVPEYIPGPGAAILASAVPAPYEAAGDGQLSGQECADLTTCEAALENLRVAFWAAGKALHLIRDARLYRGTHRTFEAYVEERWEMSRPQAYRLIEAWPLAERLSPMGDKLNERQVRELLPLAMRHGPDAAATVYQAVAAAGGVQVTAALLHGAVAALPADHFDPAEAARQIHAYLDSRDSQSSRSAAGHDPLEVFTAATARLLRVLHRAADGGALQAAAQHDPATVRKALSELRALLDAIEQGAL